MLVNSLLNGMTSTFDFKEHSHRRLNPLTNSYVICSPHRAKRPWQGAKEDIKKTKPIVHDPQCYLCPGNIRAKGDINPSYTSTYVFLNDYPAIREEQPDYHESDSRSTDLEKRLLKTEGVRGKCYVICFSPNHSLTIPLMPVSDVKNIVDTWQSLYNDLKSQKDCKVRLKYLQIFENKGYAMGCSNPHPHGQAWCLDTIPTEVSCELHNMTNYMKQFGSHLLGDYVKLEIEKKDRVILQNDSFIVVVPYWALWPFETLVIAKTHLKSLSDFSEKQKEDLAIILKKLTTKYDNLFLTNFPYSMGLHQAPLNGTKEEIENSWFHIHYYPPLLRSATVKKFCVGFEMLGEAQRDITSEQAASMLQHLDENSHYTEK